MPCIHINAWCPPPCAALQEAGCYKVILDCSEENVPFYEKCGLTKKEVQMVRCVDTSVPREQYYY